MRITSLPVYLKMQTSASNYVISGGLEGKSRLRLLSQTLKSYTKEILMKSGLKTGQSFLDCGCGGGDVSLLAASIAKEGKLVGVDVDPIVIELAKKDAEHLPNIHFQQSSIYELPFKDEFDVVYARFLLSHLPPNMALMKMIEAAKPGGRIVVEDVHFSGHFCYPANKAFDKYVQLYMEVVSSNGGDAELGVRLPSIFKSAGLKNISFDVIQPVFTKEEGKWMAYITLEKIKPALLRANIVAEQELNELLEELAAFTRNEQTLISMPRIFRVIGEKQ
jgi:ubiquinone/menaquinone biosynthesis C-methylase UbiE